MELFCCSFLIKVWLKLRVIDVIFSLNVCVDCIGDFRCGMLDFFILKIMLLFVGLDWCNGEKFFGYGGLFVVQSVDWSVRGIVLWFFWSGEKVFVDWWKGDVNFVEFDFFCDKI